MKTLSRPAFAGLLVLVCAIGLYAAPIPSAVDFARPLIAPALVLFSAVLEFVALRRSNHVTLNSGAWPAAALILGGLLGASLVYAGRWAATSEILTGLLPLILVPADLIFCVAVVVRLARSKGVPSTPDVSPRLTHPDGE